MEPSSETRNKNAEMRTVKTNEVCCHGPGYQAYQLLRIAFTILPILAGLDKFANILGNWGLYLSAPFNVLGNVHTTMAVVGIVEIIVGILVWIKPKIFAYLVSLWILLIIINLLILGNFYDIVLRDVALLLSALALARLSHKFDVSCCHVSKPKKLEE